MEYQMIHCPGCQGRGRIFDAGIGEDGAWINCLDCEGRGIMEKSHAKEVQKRVDKECELHEIERALEEREHKLLLAKIHKEQTEWARSMDIKAIIIMIALA